MIIIHAGMRNTGSSSIQQTFAKLDGDRVDYAPWRAANHSGLFFLHLHSSPEKQGDSVWWVPVPTILENCATHGASGSDRCWNAVVNNKPRAR
ncbi:MAG: hypothetical protein GDA35_10495 [Hyphomonadaceae bacterium]|nr:hypothetical protein [Hyphomonadaceae bacterium]